jgi:hypothetical protein
MITLILSIVVGSAIANRVEFERADIETGFAEVEAIPEELLPPSE